MKKVLVIGSGGREHAIINKFRESKQVATIFALSGNAGIAQIAQCIDNIAIDDHQKIIEFCNKEKIDLVFIGPEQPLVNGIVDDLQKAGIKVFGASKMAAQLEGSKDFMKRIVSENNVPTAKYKSFSQKESALKFCQEIGFPCVIKTDGLAAGKGVIIVQNQDEAQQTIDEIFAGKFGAAGNKIIIEEFLEGFEISYFVISDGKNFLPLGSACDHKRVGENDTGANTGGMGTYSPAPLLDKKLEEEVLQKIIKPTLQGMEKIGSPFVGILFAGLMITKNGAKLLEFNIRFGDPETQVILPRIKSDFYQLIEDATNQNLQNAEIKFDENKKTVCVVMCSKGYPENYQKNTEIKNLETAQKNTNVTILHAGTAIKEGKLVAVGGRVLNIVACTDSFKTSREECYKAIDLIDWENGFVRRDIAAKA